MVSVKKRDFFISYNKADKNWAEWIAWQLEEADYSIHIQAWDFGAGQNFVFMMDEAMKSSDRTIAVLSPDYLTSTYTSPEWQEAFNRDPRGEKGVLVPVKVCECEIKGILAQINYINLLGLDENRAKEVLVNAVSKQPRL